MKVFYNIKSSESMEMRRPRGAVVRKAGCCTKGPGFESRVRHKCQYFLSSASPVTAWFCTL